MWHWVVQETFIFILILSTLTKCFYCIMLLIKEMWISLIWFGTSMRKQIKNQSTNTYISFKTDKLPFYVFTVEAF